MVELIGPLVCAFPMCSIDRVELVDMVWYDTDRVQLSRWN
jgi:hypothetical protein